MTKKLKYLMQHASFVFCRKAFKEDVYYLPENKSKPVPSCLECGGQMWEMGRTFKAPKHSDLKKLRKVEALVRNGITFHSYGSHGLGRFPRLLNQVAPFIERVNRRSENTGQRLLRKLSKPKPN